MPLYYIGSYFVYVDMCIGCMFVCSVSIMCGMFSVLCEVCMLCCIVLYLLCVECMLCDSGCCFDYVVCSFVYCIYVVCMFCMLLHVVGFVIASCV